MLNQLEWRDRTNVVVPSISTEPSPPELGHDGVVARVALRCRFAAERRAEDCGLITEEPMGAQFGALSLKIYPALRVRPPLIGVALKPGDSFTLLLTFRGLSSSPEEAHVFTYPDWAHNPMTDGTVEKYAPVFPSGVSGGVAVLRCDAILSSGQLSGCKVARETPAGIGLGEAAMRMTGEFHMWPATVDGVAVDGPGVTIPLKFKSH